MERSDARAPESATVSKLLLWFGFLGGPVAWALHLGVRYPLVPVACRHDLEIAMHVVTVVCASGAVGAALAGWKVHRSAERSLAEVPGNGTRVAERQSFLGRGGVIMAVFFLFTILAEALASAFEHPCTLMGPPL